MIGILIVADGPYRIEDASSITVPADDEPLREGNYYIAPEDQSTTVATTQEPVAVRMISLGTGARVGAFRDAVRDRDNGGSGSTTTFPDGSPFSQLSAVQSTVQNGLLLDLIHHALFDTYQVSINPDDGYRLVWFQQNEVCSSMTLAPHTLQDERRPAAELLRWHFRQAVLANMRGAGEPVFEHDFPPGSDMLDTIRNGPRAAEMMEAELFGRLALQVDFEDAETSREAVEDVSERQQPP
ncbi:MAG: hypothetical protein STHCBS139747_005384 [Sporothrix thermara]